MLHDQQTHAQEVKVFERASLETDPNSLGYLPNLNGFEETFEDFFDDAPEARIAVDVQHPDIFDAIIALGDQQAPLHAARFPIDRSPAFDHRILAILACVRVSVARVSSLRFEPLPKDLLKWKLRVVILRLRACQLIVRPCWPQPRWSQFGRVSDSV